MSKNTWSNKMKKLIITILLILTQLSAITYEYDELNRLATATYENGVVYTYSYDNAGNLQSITSKGVKEIDTDGDGISDTKEAELGLRPDKKDSDDDGYSDLEEVGDINHPRDTDGDGIIDALDAQTHSGAPSGNTGGTSSDDNATNTEKGDSGDKDDSDANHPPKIEPISDKIYYQNFEDKQIALHATDSDGQNLLFDANITKEGIISGIEISDNLMTIHSLPNAYGKTDIIVSVSDGQLKDSTVFGLYVLPIDNETTIVEIGETTTSEANGTKEYVTKLGENVEVKRTEESSGTVMYAIKIEDKSIKAISDLIGSTVTLTQNGAKIAYKSDEMQAEASTTIKGVTVHTLKANGKEATAIAEALGTQTLITKDSDDKVMITTSFENDNAKLLAIAYEDGSAEHSVEVRGMQSIMQSRISGARTKLTSANVKTEVVVDNTVNTIKMVGVTDNDGTSKTYLEEYEDEKTLLGKYPTLDPSTPLPIGNSVVIKRLNNKAYIIIETPLIDDLIVK